MYSMTRELPEIRERISEIDSRIIPLLVERMWFSVEVAMYKMAHGLPVFDPVREAEILEGIENPHIRAIYRAIMDESKQVQQAIVSR